MRSPSQRKKIEALMNELGRSVSKPVRVYFTGGATAVLLEIRKSTIDVDIKFEPESEEMFRAIQQLKEKLDINIELAAPDNFIPPLPQWKERSIFIGNSGKVRFYHYDLYSQFLSKIQRGWKQDMEDSTGFYKMGIDKNILIHLFDKIKPEFIKYPSVNPEILEKKMLLFINEN